MKIYKIKHKVTGLFSKGGNYCDSGGVSPWYWTKKGKTWSSEGAVRGHLNAYTRPPRRYYDNPDPELIPEDWEVIEVVVNEDGTASTNTYSAKEFYKLGKGTEWFLKQKKN